MDVGIGTTPLEDSTEHFTQIHVTVPRDLVVPLLGTYTKKTRAGVHLEACTVMLTKQYLHSKTREPHKAKATRKFISKSTGDSITEQLHSEHSQPRWTYSCPLTRMSVLNIMLNKKHQSKDYIQFTILIGKLKKQAN